MKTIFLIDDEENQLKLLSGAIEEKGYGRVVSFTDPLKALDSIDKYMPFLIITDMKMPQMSGFEFLQNVKNKYSDIEVIVLTGYGDVSEAVDCMKAGAYYYMLKPIDIYELFPIVERIYKNIRLTDKTIVLSEEIEGIYGKFIFADKKMIDIVKRAEKVAVTDSPVFITGAGHIPLW